MTISEPETTVTIRDYEDADHEAAVALFTRINRELAPADMRERFEEYIATSIAGELIRLKEIFAPAKRNAFWVVVINGEIIGSFGIESRGEDTTELRRMYLDRPYRGRGIAQRMLLCAENRARNLGFSTLILSTAEIQLAALAFYRKSGYQLVATERADSMSTKTVGGGLTRFHFKKPLLTGE
jgi:GNAT superfamily N-acetyltransferase